jgi:hypothetical protein
MIGRCVSARRSSGDRAGDSASGAGRESPSSSRQTETVVPKASMEAPLSAHPYWHFVRLSERIAGGYGGLRAARNRGNRHCHSFQVAW